MAFSPVRRRLSNGPTPSRIADAVNRRLLDSGISLLQDLSSAAFAAERATFSGTATMPRASVLSSEWRGRKRSAAEIAAAIDGASGINPFEMVADDLVEMRVGMARLVESGLVSRIAARDAPYRNIGGSLRTARGADDLVDAAAYLSRLEGGKLFRPTLVMLMASATNAHELAAARAAGSDSGDSTPSAAPITTNVAQLRLAEITELIHTASLLHDDILDEAATRRGMASMNAQFDGLTAVMLGDVLLARSSVALARLRSPPVVELLSSVLEQLVEGELMQAKEQSDAPQLKLPKIVSWLTGGSSDADRNAELESLFTRYIRKRCGGGVGCPRSIGLAPAATHPPPHTHALARLTPLLHLLLLLLLHARSTTTTTRTAI